MIYEWDNKKNEYNKKNHDGISFEFAVRVFLDEKRIEKYDSSHSTDTEDRWNVIGMVDDVLFVVYTERNDRTRIISARKATKEETDEYYDDYDLR
ncbi:BrnT family toxin [uncultured Treponema sp.]|uniref:BrnT family toxin n=1 Tax=uncultured Treponema sp. TaxID=162155 RepID=UPI00258BE599|nr:BrnT family toxin [uncultured Treponema sp.]